MGGAPPGLAGGGRTPPGRRLPAPPAALAAAPGAGRGARRPGRGRPRRARARPCRRRGPDHAPADRRSTPMSVGISIRANAGTDGIGGTITLQAAADLNVTDTGAILALGGFV